MNVWKGNEACYEKEGTLGTSPEAISQYILLLSPAGKFRPLWPDLNTPETSKKFTTDFDLLRTAIRRKKGVSKAWRATPTEYQYAVSNFGNITLKQDLKYFSIFSKSIYYSCS